MAKQKTAHTKKIGDKVCKQLSVWLPETFMNNYENYVTGANNKNEEVYNISSKVVVHRALVEYMENHPA